MLEQSAAADSPVPPKALIVPHAGYIYSGPVAASAYARIAPWRGRIRSVVMFGPAHRLAAQAAFGLPQVGLSVRCHELEHSLEVQLPFLIRVLGEFSLLPFAVGYATPCEVAEVIELLWGGDETLIVISSDLSHYHSCRDARELDHARADSILALDPGLDHEQACGATPIAGLLLCAARHGLTPRRLDLRNSGDTAGPIVCRRVASTPECRGIYCAP